ncbi:MAG: DNA-protecting protein DprA [Nitrospinae bacterium]|nr:DNA-protecting protein DprA [Nitrospinota bacterium]
MDDARACRIALNAIPFMHPALYHRLVAAFGSARAVFGASTAELLSVRDAAPALVESIRESDPVKLAERETALAAKLSARILLMDDEGYPAPLASAAAPPPVLTVAGEWKKEDEAALAVVGTRAPTTYGKAMTQKFTVALVKAGLTIVSGLARGVDGVAHRAALECGGRTVAVLGCGLNVFYPPEHRELQGRIAGQGAVISQFPCAAAPSKVTFPARNRVISGLSLGALVVEAPEKSGALITAYAALEDNREVFALPGPVNSPRSEGTNRLIQKGHAKLALSVDDILDELPPAVRDAARQGQLTLSLEKRAPELDGEERALLHLLDHEERHIDDLAQAAGLPSHKASVILLSLEIKGLVTQSAGKMFSRS